mgnify:FL=1|tara:strand:+ start:1108 stop:1341 length:234 start_codon:yes stop_codon:yes gene_type:complete
MVSKSRRRGTNLSLFKKELRKLLKKHKKSALAKSVSRKSRKKRKKSLAKYRSSASKNSNINYGGAVRDGSPQQFLKC